MLFCYVLSIFAFDIVGRFLLLSEEIQFLSIIIITH